MRVDAGLFCNHGQEFAPGQAVRASHADGFILGRGVLNGISQTAGHVDVRQGAEVVFNGPEGPGIRLAQAQHLRDLEQFKILIQAR